MFSAILSPFIEFGQISTVVYFAHFLIIVIVAVGLSNINGGGADGNRQHRMLWQ